MAYGIYERREIEAIRGIVSLGDTVIDVGANIGYVAAHLAQMVGPSGKVYAFEPGTTPLAFLREVVASNRFANIEAFPYAVSDRCGMTSYFETDAILAKGYGRIGKRPSARFADVRERQVEVTSLDAFLAGRDTWRLSFIKVDVEGHERQVLHGMEGLFARGCRPAIMTEATASPMGLPELRNYAAFLERFGYSMWCVGSPLRPGRIDDLAPNFHGNVFWISRCN